MKHGRKLLIQWALHHQEKEYINGERASTKTRAASLERTGSIKITKSLVDNKSGYTVEIRSRSKLGSRPGSRAGSRDRWVSSRWTDNEDDIEKGKDVGIHVTGEKKVLIAKVKNSIILLCKARKLDTN